MTTTTAFDIAAEIRRHNATVGAVKLHKLMYYCQGWHLALAKTALFAESIEAWDKGPVVAELWRAERAGKSPAANPLDDDQISTVEFVMSRYGMLSARELIQLSHEETPWRAVYSTLRPVEITVDALVEYFVVSQDRELKRADEIVDAIGYRSRSPLEIAMTPPQRNLGDSRSLRARLDDLLAVKYA